MRFSRVSIVQPLFGRRCAPRMLLGGPNDAYRSQNASGTDGHLARKSHTIE